MTERKQEKDPVESCGLEIARIEQSIYLIRGSRVMLDSDLAALYEVETRHLKRQVTRNLSRFPDDFMFQLTAYEWHRLRCQFGTSKGRGGVRYPPYAFTEQGVAMLSSVLRSERAVQANIQIVRAFVRIRELMLTHKDLARKLEQLEAKYDQQFAVVFDAIRQLLEPPPRKRQRRIGFQ